MQQQIICGARLTTLFEHKQQVAANQPFV